MDKSSASDTIDTHAATLAEFGRRVATGSVADVWLVDEALVEYNALVLRTDANGRKAAVQLPRYFKRYADGNRLSDQQYKPQGRKKSGHCAMQIWEFKGFQYRIYGVVVDVGGKRSFIGTSTDPGKKNNKADPAIVQRALDNFVRMFT